jgi:hypothetical protein
VISGGQALERNRDLDPTSGWHWRELLARYRAEGGLQSIWDQMCLSEPVLAEAIERGDVVEDDRLALDLGPARHQPVRDAGPARPAAGASTVPPP